MARKAKSKKTKSNQKIAQEKRARRGARPTNVSQSKSTTRAKSKSATGSRQGGESKAKSGKRVPPPRSKAKGMTSDPVGQVGWNHPDGRGKRGKKEPRELAKSEPDARFGDARDPKGTAREHPGGSMPALERRVR